MSRMQRLDWTRRLAGRARPRRLKHFEKLSHFRRLAAEPLENRRMLAVITVDSLLDNFDPGAPTVDGLITLREAIVATNTDAAVGDAPAGSGADTINFAGSLDGGTVDLSQTFGELAITDSLTIDASSLTSGLTIDAGDGTDNTFNTGDGVRVFNVDDADFMNQIDVELRGLTLTGGDVAGDGGAIYSVEDLQVAGTVVDANAATTYGGGIFAGGNGVTITGSTISGNATGTSGGGVAANADVSITSSTVSGNTAAGGGGGVAASDSALTVVDSTVSGNTSVVEGGGIAFLDGGGTLSITNSTISQNQSNLSGGGVATGMISSATIAHSTLTGNTADADNNASGVGGGLYVEAGTPSANVFTVTHTIVAANTDLSGSAPDFAVATGTVRFLYSLVGDNTGAGLTEAPVGMPDGNGNLIGEPSGIGGIIDPLLNPLANNGGPTQTHALQVGSPAIDAGNPNTSSAPSYDQRGEPFVRVFDFDQNSAPFIDMGAYELQVQGTSQVFIVDTLNDESDGIFTAGDFSLREAVEQANQDVAADTILFDLALGGGTINLKPSLGEIVITGETTIDATALADGLTVEAKQQSRIFHIDDGNNNLDTPVEIAGLTLINGRANKGGAIHSEEALTVRLSTITGNSATGKGGGIYEAHGTLVVDQSTISNNSSVYEGGGIRAELFSDITLMGSTVSGNSTLGNDAYGGGISASYGNVTLSDSTVSGNNTLGIDAYGGGISTRTGNVTLTNSTVSGNSTLGTAADGGGIRARFGDVTLTNSTVSGNSTSGSAAGGGGIFASGKVTLTNSTVTDNHANYSNSRGGGIHSSTGAVTILGSIVAGNTAGGGKPDLDPGTGTLKLDYSLIGNTSGTGITAGTGTGNLLGVDPQLGPLADNGGPTKTHALLPGSPAIDGGFSQSSMGLAYDQRGAPFIRVFDGDQDLNPLTDMGAFEFQVQGTSQVFIVDTVFDESDGDFSAGDFSLREALEQANLDIAADTVLFDDVLGGGTVFLTLGQLVATSSVTIDAASLGSLTIDAQGNSRIFKFDDGNLANDDPDFAIAALTLIGGNDTGGFATEGGAISSKDSLTVTDSTISGSTSSGSGGGIAVYDDLLLTGTTVLGNYSGNRGGGIRAYGNVMITDSIIVGNSTSGNNAVGGGIKVSDGDLTITNSTVSGNSTAGSTTSNGGGIYLIGDLTLTGSTVSDNNSSGGGGGIKVIGKAKITDSTISGNSTSETNARGGGIAATFDLTLTNSTVSGNITSGLSAYGGGIQVSKGDVVLTGSTVIDNQVYASNAAGGGISIFGTGAITISGSIVAGNTAGGGNPDLKPGTTGTLIVDYSLIGDNAGTSLVEAQTPDGDGNLIGSSSGGVIDPMLGSLADNGGFTLPDGVRIMTREPIVGSPVIDAGDPTAMAGVGSVPLFDQRSDPFARVFDGDGAGGARIDMGAVELQTVNQNLIVDTLVDENDGDYSSGDFSLREAVAWTNAVFGPGSITFWSSLDGGTIALDQSLGELAILDPVTIDASGLVAGLTIDAGNGTDGMFGTRDGVRIFNIDDSDSGVNIDVELRGLTLTGGDVIGVGVGGAIRSVENLTLVNSTITANAAGGDGGGIYSFTGNSGTTTISSSTISGNKAVGTVAVGGGIYARTESGTITISDSTLSGNSAVDDGGGIYSFTGNGGATTIRSSAVTGNAAVGMFANGGGIYARTATGGSTTISYSTLSGNSAGRSAGGIFAQSTENSTTTIHSSTISGNMADANGGGLYTSTTSAFGATVTVAHSTITGNTSDEDTSGIGSGGGIYNFYGGLTLDHTIVAGNTDTTTTAHDIHNSVAASYSLIGDTTGATITDNGGNLLNQNPMLGPLADNGGPTKTHALLSGSPAIDAGDPSFTVPPDFDQRGAPFARVSDGDSLGGANIDIGAFEVDNTPPVVTTVERNGGGQNFDELITLAFTFSEDVLASIDKLDLVLVNTSTATAVDLTAAVLSYDASTNTATWDLSGAPIEVGFHSATLSAAGISDASSNQLDGDSDGTGGDDFVATQATGLPLLVALAGDTNLDGQIDNSDILGILSANSFGNGTGFNWTQGDFNGDTEVDNSDILAILATGKFGTGPYAATSSPESGAPLAASGSAAERIEFSAPGASMPHVGAVMRKHNLRAALAVPVSDNLHSDRTAVFDRSGDSLQHGARRPRLLETGARRWEVSRPVRRSHHSLTTAEVDIALVDLTGERVEGREHGHLAADRYAHRLALPSQVDWLDLAWDQALLALLGGEHEQQQ